MQQQNQDAFKSMNHNKQKNFQKFNLDEKVYDEKNADTFGFAGDDDNDDDYDNQGLEDN